MILNRLKALREEVTALNVGTVSDLGTPPKSGLPTRRVTDTAVLRRGKSYCPDCGEKDCACDMVEQVGTYQDLGIRPSSDPPKKILMNPRVHLEVGVENCPACGGRLAKDYCVKCRDFTGNLSQVDIEDTIYDPEEGEI